MYRIQIRPPSISIQEKMPEHNGICSEEERADQTHANEVSSEDKEVLSTVEKWWNYYEKLCSLCHALTPENARKISRYVHGIPYFPETLKTTLHEASENFCRVFDALHEMNSTSDSNDGNAMSDPTRSNDGNVMSDPPSNDLTLSELLGKLMSHAGSS